MIAARWRSRWHGLAWRSPIAGSAQFLGHDFDHLPGEQEKRAARLDTCSQAWKQGDDGAGPRSIDRLRRHCRR